MAGPASRVRERLEKRGKGKSQAALLEDALRDWRSGRAFVRGKHHTYWLRPLVVSHGVVSVGYGRAKAAPWSKVANEVWGRSTDMIHKLSHEKYPEGHVTDFERLHAMSRTRQSLLEETARLEGLR